MSRILYHIIKKKIFNKGELCEISERLTSIAKKCTGICIPSFFLMDDFLGNSIPKIEATVNMNHKSEIPCNMQAAHEKDIARSPAFLDFDVDLKSNYINGFIRDRSEVFTSPYTVTIYLRLEV